MQRILKAKKAFLFAWLLHQSHKLKYAQCRPYQSHSFNKHMQAQNMQVKLTAGVVVQKIDKEERRAATSVGPGMVM